MVKNKLKVKVNIHKINRITGNHSLAETGNKVIKASTTIPPTKMNDIIKETKKRILPKVFIDYNFILQI